MFGVGDLLRSDRLEVVSSERVFFRKIAKLIKLAPMNAEENQFASYLHARQRVQYYLDKILIISRKVQKKR